MQLRTASLCLLVAITASGAALAQNLDRDRATVHYTQGLEHLRAETFDKAATAFQKAVEIDATFEMAHYMLGRARMYTKEYARALTALTRARTLYVDQGGRQFASALEAKQHLKEKVREIDAYLRDLSFRPQTRAVLAEIRQINEYKRRLQDDVERGRDLSVRTPAPAFVLLSLGSAHFRLGQLTEAEKVYKETIEVDPRSGEAFNNLAALYFETGRGIEADKAMRAAEKTGFTVHPDLKEGIAKLLKQRLLPPA
jgi:tetratricopeptide (TPR) repeat protein